MVISNWYGAIVIVVAKVHFALTIALYEIPLSYRLLKKFILTVVLLLL